MNKKLWRTMNRINIDWPSKSINFSCFKTKFVTAGLFKCQSRIISKLLDILISNHILVLTIFDRYVHDFYGYYQWVINITMKMFISNLYSKKGKTLLWGIFRNKRKPGTYWGWILQD